MPDAKAANIYLSNPDDLPLTSLLTFTLKSPDRFPRNGQVEIETLDGTLRTVLTLAPSGGLLLQDPHTIVATLDPLRSFGPSAFGALRMRAIYPVVADRSTSRHAQPEAAAQSETATPSATTPSTDATVSESESDDLSSPASDWLPLVTLVRLPTLSQLQCPAETTQPCTLSGNNFFMLQSLALNPDYTDPVPVPDGYTGISLSVPHPTAATIFFKLRDDPASIDSAVMPMPAPPVTAHLHHPSRSAQNEPQPSSAEPEPGTPVPTTTVPTTPTTQTTPTPQKQESPTPVAPSSLSKTSPSRL